MEASAWPSTEFSAWVRQQLRRRQWNDAELARQLDIPRGTVSRWMRGERQPSTRSCDLIADVFGVDVDLVLTLAGHRPQPGVAQPDDPRTDLIAMLNRVQLTPDRLAGLEGTLRAWLEIDRAARSREGGGGRREPEGEHASAVRPPPPAS